MLGLADRGAVFDLFDALMAGDAKGALDRFDVLYRDGADPVIVLQDLLEATYWLTRIQEAPEVADAPHTPETERGRTRVGQGESVERRVDFGGSRMRKKKKQKK